MKKVFVAFSVIFLLLSTEVIGTAKSINTENNEDKNIAIEKPADVSEFFSHQKNYVPGEHVNKAIKTIYLAFHIWQDEDGTGNLSRSDFVYENLYDIVDRLNSRFRRAHTPVRPVEGVDYIRDSHIRFELKGIHYYQNAENHTVGCGAGQRLNQYVFRDNPQNREYLNIHFVKGSCRGASGYANYPSSRNLEADSYVVTYVKPYWKEEERYPFYATMVHLAHEIGHNMGLRHPYDSEYCNFSHPDYLFDLFGSEKQDWCDNPRGNCDVCYHEGGWVCDLEDPKTTCTNNIMGGNRNAGSITPLQMGRMNRSLSRKSVRKYAWGYSDSAFVVDKNELWDFNQKFYQDIRVKSGVTLYLTGELEMVPQAGIILEPGSLLVVDGGLITNALYSHSFWQGIKKEPKPSRGLAFWKSRPDKGKVILKNDGNIENTLMEPSGSQ